MKNLLGGKGANLHEMASLGLPVPPGFTITTEVCTYFYANGKTYPPDLAAQVDAARRGGRPPDGARLRRRGQSAAGLGALGRARLDARHDGHRPQPRPQRRVGRDAGQDVGRRALRLRLLSPLHPDVFATSCSTSTIHEFEDILEHYKDGKGYTLDTDLDRGGLARGHRRLQGQGRRGDRQAIPAEVRATSCGARSARCSRRG